MREGWGLKKWPYSFSNGASVAAKAIELTSIDLYDHDFLLDNVLYVPNALEDIILVSSLTRKNYVFHFKNNVYNIYFGNEMVGMDY